MRLLKKYWDIYFQKLNSLLKINGTACLQIITINENSFRKYLNNVDFIQKYIFPGGMLPKTFYKNYLSKMDLNYIIKFHSAMTIQEHWGVEKKF